MKIKNRTVKAILIATGVIFFWRGAWGLMDHFLLPDNPLISYVISLVIGVLILYLTHRLIKNLSN